MPAGGPACRVDGLLAADPEPIDDEPLRLRGGPENDGGPVPREGGEVNDRSVFDRSVIDAHSREEIAVQVRGDGAALRRFVTIRARPFA